MFTEPNIIVRFSLILFDGIKIGLLVYPNFHGLKRVRLRLNVKTNLLMITNGPRRRGVFGKNARSEQLIGERKLIFYRDP